MLKALDTDAEVKAVIAHEIEHIEARHSLRVIKSREKTAWITGLIASAIGGIFDRENIASILDGLAGLTTELVNLGYGREMEREADAAAALYLNHAGHGTIPLLRVLRKLAFISVGEYSLFSTHPYIQDRIKVLDDRRDGALMNPVAFEGIHKNALRTEPVGTIYFIGVEQDTIDVQIDVSPDIRGKPNAGRIRIRNECGTKITFSPVITFRMIGGKTINTRFYESKVERSAGCPSYLTVDSKINAMNMEVGNHRLGEIQWTRVTGQ